MCENQQWKTHVFKGHIMLFGLFRIRKDFAFWQEIGSRNKTCSPHVNSNGYIERLEPFLQKICTIKWIETDLVTEKEVCYL